MVPWATMVDRGDRSVLDDGLQLARTLERSVYRRADECTDSTLASVLRQIAARRGARRRTSRTGNASQVEGTSAPTRPLSPDVRIFSVPRPPGFTFRAGQHVKLAVAGVSKARPYSIASAPHDPQLEFCIERVPGGRLTSPLFAGRGRLALASGARAKGSFVLDPKAATHLMVATVTGIAPRMDFVEYRATVSRPDEPANREWDGAVGRVDALAISTAAKLDPSTTRVYACGNAGMIDNVRRQLSSAGFSVSSEAFDD